MEDSPSPYHMTVVRKGHCPHEHGGVTMPRGDGTGPGGQGPGSGRGLGRGAGRGRMAGNRAGAGPGGDCVCPQCGARAPHTVGMPCYDQTCPRCGARMARD